MANVKPFLLIQSQTYESLKSIRITNNGLGPAIIKRAEFKKPGGTPTDKIVELFDYLRLAEPRWRVWERFVNVSEKKGIEVHIEYEDIFGRKMEPLIDTLK